MPKARYALEMLLRPLGLEPDWTNESPELYYGPQPDTSPAALRFELRPETTGYFERREAWPPDEVIEHEDLVYLFGGAEAPDPIASTFFLLSGWDEFVTTERDEHARFCHRHSVQSKLDIALVPIVDHYRLRLAASLEAAGVEIRWRQWSGKDWAYAPTFDIDYLREWRPGTIAARGWRQPVRLLRGLLTGADAHLEGVHNLLAMLEAGEATGTFFFKSGNRSAYDPSYRRSERAIKQLLGMVREQGSGIGLHPGYYASTHPDYLQAEKEDLERLLGGDLHTVRQHYLRYELPHTSRLHAQAGFRVDSTLGFPDHEGFRRGTCHPFRIYDPIRNEPLNLWEMPLCFMDSTMIHRRRLTPGQSADVLKELMNACRAVRGSCVVLFHNILWERGMEGWPEVLEKSLITAAEFDAASMSLTTL